MASVLKRLGKGRGWETFVSPIELEHDRGVTDSNEDSRRICRILPPLKIKASEPDLYDALSKSYTCEKFYLE